MKLDSKIFDSIRVGTKQKVAAAPTEHPDCQWKGCDRQGKFRAPKGRGREGEFFFFCVDHVREYNASYNYFDGMSASDVEDFQKDALTGHRPTWKMGAGAAPADAAARAAQPGAGPASRATDPHQFFAWRAKQAREESVEKRRQLKPLEKKSLNALQLEPGATREAIKTRFKDLVKRHHPDVNGGDSRSEERLREIIQAYNYLKQAGLV